MIGHGTTIIQLEINSIVATKLFSLCRLDIPKLYGVPFNMRVYHASMLNPFIVMSSICIRTHINFSTCKCTENLRIYGHIQWVIVAIAITATDALFPFHSCIIQLPQHDGKSDVATTEDLHSYLSTCLTAFVMRRCFCFVLFISLMRSSDFLLRF